MEECCHEMFFLDISKSIFEIWDYWVVEFVQQV